VRFISPVNIERVAYDDGLFSLNISGKRGTAGLIEGSHLLIATGRRPNIEGLGLERAGVAHDRRGVRISRKLLTSNKRVFAIGDVTGGLQFTHMANYQAGIVIRRALFRLPAKASERAFPMAIYTEPELARTGMSEDEARKSGADLKILRWPYSENDRAIAERKEEGFIKVICDGKGRILGATIIGEQAGELIQIWTMAIQQKLNIKSMTEIIFPYPTLSEISKRAAYGFYAGKLSGGMMRNVVRWLGKLG
jgi:pyruvate/2-oxoglutarate dehydrogenase complex dihydrolipoamide dehydrogenase (E3) component